MHPYICVYKVTKYNMDNLSECEQTSQHCNQSSRLLTWNWGIQVGFRDMDKHSNSPSEEK